MAVALPNRCAVATAAPLRQLRPPSLVNPAPAHRVAGACHSVQGMGLEAAAAAAGVGWRWPRAADRDLCGCPATLENSGCRSLAHSPAVAPQKLTIALPQRPRNARHAHQRRVRRNLLDSINPTKMQKLNINPNNLMFLPH